MKIYSTSFAQVIYHQFLTPELSKGIVDAGLDFIQISVEGTSAEKYEQVTGVKINYEKLVENVKYLYQVSRGKCKVHCKILDTNLTSSEKEKFYLDFQDISDECYMEKLLDVMPKDMMDTTLGYSATTTQEGKELKEKKICTIPFYVLAVYWDGKVGVCGCDYKRNPTMGDVRNEDLVSIWNNERFVSFRKAQLMGNRKKFLSCSDCKAILNQLDDIDEYGQVLLKKYEYGEDT